MSWNSGIPRSGRPSGVPRSLITGSSVARRTPAADLLNGSSDTPEVPDDKTTSADLSAPPNDKTTSADLSAPPNLSISFKLKETSRGMVFPEVDPHFLVQAKDKVLLDIVNEMSKHDPQNLLLVGPQGCGKTELAVWFAAKYNRPLLLMNCASIRETKDWFGFRDAKAGTLTWHKSEFVRAVTTGNAVVLLDEFNRLPTTLHNTLYPLLDARRSSFIEDLEETVNVAPGTVFFATANIGIQHTGTFTLDSALEDRFVYRIDVSFLSEQEEVDIIVKKTGLPRQWARKLGTLATTIRQKANVDSMESTLTRTISTRQLLHCAALMRFYMARSLPVRQVFDYCLVPSFSKDGGRDSEQAQVLQIIQGIFGDNRG